MFKFIKDVKESYEVGCSYDGEKPTLRKTIWFITKEVWEFYISNFLCNRFGHKYENTGGYANGNTGGDEFTCSRCRKEINHTYY